MLDYEYLHLFNQGLYIYILSLMKFRAFTVILFLALCLIQHNSKAQSPQVGMYLNNETVTYEQAMDFYKKMANDHKEAKLINYGLTDIGKPLSLFVLSKDKDFDPASLKRKNKRILLINNAIHPGEPCGVDACIKLVEDLLEKKKVPFNLNNLVICIIPMYNIGGALNRNCCSRVNQNGPKEYGFRGNAQNLDLNRDFIKADSKNAKAFFQIFQTWDPDVFVDTHTSNGADYQYVMTLITTQLDKLNTTLASYVRYKLNPALFNNMKEKGFEMIPYVNLVDKTPDKGIKSFLETPRYSTGYSALFNTIGFTTEAHMFKPFKDRVLGTYHFIVTLAAYINSNHEELGKIRENAKKESIVQKYFPIKWESDTTKFSSIYFKGFESLYKTSKITAKDRLYYDRNKPYTKQIKYFNRCRTVLSVKKPYAYIIPQGWEKAIERMLLNGIVMEKLTNDTMMRAEMYYIDAYETRKYPYEGHYLHYKVATRTEIQDIRFYKGDYLIKLNQDKNRYIVETLEPAASDSYFAWNLFDPILQQKEWFSSYVFEEKAEEILVSNPLLRKKFESKLATDLQFSNDSREQLRYIYKESDYYEKSHNRYPVARIMNMAK